MNKRCKTLKIDNSFRYDQTDQLSSDVSFLQKGIDLIEKDDGIKDWRSIYEVSSDVYFREEERFTKEFLLHCKNYANIPENIPS